MQSRSKRNSNGQSLGIGQPIGLLLRALIPLSLLGVCAGLLQTTGRLEQYCSSPYPVSPPLQYHQALVTQKAVSSQPAPVVASPRPIPLEISPGETLSGMLDGAGVKAEEARAIVELAADHVDLRSLRAGDPYTVFVDRDSAFDSLELVRRGEGRLRLAKAEGDWKASWKPFVRTVSVRRTLGVLEGSLDGSLRDAGGRSALAYHMADIFQWDLDFNRDLRLGDRFEVLYEEEFLDGQLSGVGRVLAVHYENQGRMLEAYQHGPEGQYYDADGRPMRKMFLRSPLPFSPRITSRFTHRRFHPVLKKYRPHYGVDFGAPTGTPVRATAGGTVVFAGWDRGGGNTVKIRHPKGYLSGYLHLSKFADGIRAGSRVNQGQRIGYVGSTGLSTGPHLDYRVQKDGRWINPLSIKAVPAKALSASEMVRFREIRDAYLASLRTGAPPPLELESQVAESDEVTAVTESATAR